MIMFLFHTAFQCISLVLAVLFVSLMTDQLYLPHEWKLQEQVLYTIVSVLLQVMVHAALFWRDNDG